MISIAHPLLGAEEEAAVLRVLASGQLAQGEQVAAFERHFAKVCQVQEAVTVSSGTDALHLALLAHDIGPGDEVITSAFSFAATANAILLVASSRETTNSRLPIAEMLHRLTEPASREEVKKQEAKAALEVEA